MELLARLRGCVRPSAKNRSVTPAPPEAFASHLPVLIGLSQILSIRTVLELGCGFFSTPTFLNRRFFSQLERLDSLENDPSWIRQIASLVQKDDRWNPKVIQGSIGSAIQKIDLDRYDLVLVDDSHSYEERARTIEAIAKSQPGSGIFLIHDFESPLYQQAAQPFAERLTFDALSPNTGAHWNHGGISKPTLERLNSRIKAHVKAISPIHVDRWYGELAPHLSD